MTTEWGRFDLDDSLSSVLVARTQCYGSLSTDKQPVAAPARYPRPPVSSSLLLDSAWLELVLQRVGRLSGTAEAGQLSLQGRSLR